MKTRIESINQNFSESSISNEKNLKRVETLEVKINRQNELADKERRIKNIIFYDIPESDSQDTNTRIEEDCTKLYEIFKRKHFTFDLDKIVNITRLKKSDQNKNSSRPRAIRMIFNSLEYKKQVLTSCRDLYYVKDNLRTPIYSSNDLTFKEREERRALVAELKKRRIEDNNLVIRNGKIVSFVPFSGEVRSNRRNGWASLIQEKSN